MSQKWLLQYTLSFKAVGEKVPLPTEALPSRWNEPREHTGLPAALPTPPQGREGTYLIGESPPGGSRTHIGQSSKASRWPAWRLLVVQLCLWTDGQSYQFLGSVSGSPFAHIPLSSRSAFSLRKVIFRSPSAFHLCLFFRWFQKKMREKEAHYSNGKYAIKIEIYKTSFS